MKRLEHLEAAKAEALKLGAEISFEQGKKHIIAIVMFAGKIRKLSMSTTPKKMCSYHVVDDIRRLVRKIKDENIRKEI